MTHLRIFCSAILTAFAFQVNNMYIYIFLKSGPFLMAVLLQKMSLESREPLWRSLWDLQWCETIIIGSLRLYDTIAKLSAVRVGRGPSSLKMVRSLSYTKNEEINPNNVAKELKRWTSNWCEGMESVNTNSEVEVRSNSSWAHVFNLPKGDNKRGCKKLLADE